MVNINEKILIVDDEPQIREILSEYLTSRGYSCISACDGQDGIKKLRENQYFLIITDFKMPLLNGIDFIKEVRQTHPMIPVVMMTGYGEKDLILQALRTGVIDLIDKPFNQTIMGELVDRIANARLLEIERDMKELDDLRLVFVEESKNILLDLDPLLSDLEEDEVNIDNLNIIYRKVHTLKGSAGSLPGSGPLVRLAHSFESLLTCLKENKAPLKTDTITTMLAAFELLGACVRGIDLREELPDTTLVQQSLDQFASGKKPDSQGITSSTSEPTKAITNTKISNAARKTESSEDGVAVSNEKLEILKDLSGELVAFKNSFDVFLKQNSEALGTHLPELMEMDRMLFKITDQIQHEINDVQQVAFGRTFSKFPRVVKQVAGELGKQIKLNIIGQSMNVDRTVSRALSDALIHVVRNSCDHGVERPDTRVANGKNPTGTITIKGSQSTDMITVEVSDDGSGINVDRVRNKAVERGLVSEAESKDMKDEDVYNLLFEPNFSTAEKITDISGRGVGMDVVRTVARKFGGNAWFNSQKGQGTTLTIQFPIPKSLVVESSLVGQSGEFLIAIPLSSISEIRHVDETELTYVAPHWTLQNRGVTVPVGSYQFFIDDPALSKEEKEVACAKKSGLVAILQHRGRSVGMYLDAIVDQIEAVIRPFDDVIGRINGFRGVSRLPNDGVAYVLSAEDAVRNILDATRESARVKTA